MTLAIGKGMKEKEYRTGNVRLLSDLFWCFCILFCIAPKHILALVYTPLSAYQVGYLGSSILFSMAGIFFLVFFWSWNTRHLESKAARVVIKILFGVFVVCCIFVLWSCLYSISREPTFLGAFFLIIIALWPFAVVRKYLRIMRGLQRVDDEGLHASALDKNCYQNESSAHTLFGIKFLIGIGVFVGLVYRGQEALLRVMLQKSKPLTIHEAVVRGDSIALKKLLSAGCDANALLDGMTPLMLAAMENNADILKILITGGANPNIRHSKKFFTALDLVVKKGNYDLARFLLDNGADANASRTLFNVFGMLIARKISQLPHQLQPAAKNTLLSGQELSEDERKEIFKDSENVDSDVLANIIALLLDHGAQAQNPQGESIFDLAFFLGEPKIVKLLIDHGVDPNKTDADGNGFILKALIYKHIVGMSMPVTTEDSQRVSFIASVCPPDIADAYIDLLLKYGANPNARFADTGMTVLAFAALKNDTVVVRKLLEYGADVNLCDKEGNTALMYAKDISCAQLLLKSGANPNIKTSHGATALLVARSQHNDAMENLLQEYGAVS